MLLRRSAGTASVAGQTRKGCWLCPLGHDGAVAVLLRQRLIQSRAATVPGHPPSGRRAFGEHAARHARGRPLRSPASHGGRHASAALSPAPRFAPVRCRGPHGRSSATVGLWPLPLPSPRASPALPKTKTVVPGFPRALRVSGANQTQRVRGPNQPLPRWVWCSTPLVPGGRAPRHCHPNPNPRPQCPAAIHRRRTPAAVKALRPLRGAAGGCAAALAGHRRRP